MAATRTKITPNTVVMCTRCTAHTKSKRSTGWNVEVRRGVIVGFLCPACQTPEENAEAEINDATLDYAVDSFGRVIGTTKVAS